MHFWVNKCTFVLFRAYFIWAKEYAEKNTTLGRATSILHQFNGEEHLNRFSCNFFRQFKYTIAGVLPIVRYSFSALWQLNSRNFLQVTRHSIERLWEPQKKKNSNKELCHKQFQVAPEQVEEDVDEQLFLLEPMVPGLLHSATERKNAINIKVGRG